MRPNQRGHASMLAEERGVNLFLTNQAPGHPHVAFVEMSVRLCGPDPMAHWATCGPGTTVCPPLGYSEAPREQTSVTR